MLNPFDSRLNQNGIANVNVSNHEYSLRVDEAACLPFIPVLIPFENDSVSNELNEISLEKLRNDARKGVGECV
jgi:hypothetical protein